MVLKVHRRLVLAIAMSYDFSFLRVMSKVDQLGDLAVVLERLNPGPGETVFLQHDGADSVHKLPVLDNLDHYV